MTTSLTVAEVRDQTLFSVAYRVARPLASGEDGYARIEARKDWRPVPSWGLDGWDLGGWPYVVISHREPEVTTLGEFFELLYDVEGDSQVYRYPSREMRDRATDILAFFHWKAHSESWVEDFTHAYQCPPELRGPFSWERLNIKKVRDCVTDREV